ncbi:restriction endonuclease subunit S [Limibaculum sp. M0105]|uniref:Restriction endonuclease subunit S n=1 Tax=Thermohalobaculum xanthum TaxID=2753746 RepID=A0A8J7M7V0_9RHOB|nr:restriction endonuclease subunit S [Thermohalobaculum xanthum]MBK0399820.1 restriction endonuclease subunit S [Thermohalobaculum xanthum]
MREQVALGDVATVIAGQSPPGDTYNEAGEGLPFFQGKAEFGDVHPVVRKWCSRPNKVAEAGDILISVRAPVGPTNVAQERCCIGRGLAAIRVNEANALRDYVHWGIRFKEPELVAKGQGSTFAAISQRDLRSIQLPLPSLDEQRRIVDILNRAASIERLRAEAREKLRGFIPALFIRMFGDPVENPMGWEVRPLGELCSIERNFSIPDVDTEGDELCIGPDSIEKESGRWLQRSTVEEVRPISGKYHFESGDVLYSKIRPALRKCVIADFSGYCSADMYPLTCTRDAIPEFLYALLLSDGFSDYAVKSSTRAQMPKVNRRSLFSYPAICPPLALQTCFAEIVTTARAIAATAETASTTASALSASLMARLFREAA